MFKTIVAAHDGSENADRALEVAVDVAKRYEAALVIAHVEERVAGKGGVYPVFADEAEARTALQGKADELSAQGVEVSVEVRPVVLGGPAHALVEIADGAGADLIVSGTRGHSPVAGLVLGSVAQRLLHVAGRPVLAVPPPA